MSKTTSFSFGVAVVMSAAYAVADTPTGPVKLTFRDIGAEAQMSAFRDKITPYRAEDIVIAVSKDTVICGQKATHATAAVTGDQLVLRYELTPAPSGTTTKCTLISEFKVENLPHRDLVVSFSGGPEPATTVSMQKCPNYNPKTDDVWECLVPKK